VSTIYFPLVMNDVLDLASGQLISMSQNFSTSYKQLTGEVLGVLF